MWSSNSSILLIILILIFKLKFSHFCPQCSLEKLALYAAIRLGSFRLLFTHTSTLTHTHRHPLTSIKRETVVSLAQPQIEQVRWSLLRFVYRFLHMCADTEESRGTHSHNHTHTHIQRELPCAYTLWRGSMAAGNQCERPVQVGGAKPDAIGSVDVSSLSVLGNLSTNWVISRLWEWTYINPGAFLNTFSVPVINRKRKWNFCGTLNRPK